MLQRPCRQALKAPWVLPGKLSFHTGTLQSNESPLQDKPAATTQLRTIFSGIQPTGIPHLGNYLGALSQWTSLQAAAAPTTRLFFSIVDLHSLTLRSQTPAERRLAKHQTLAILLATGLDPARCTIFHQSSVPQHAELHWILSCNASVGALARMPTWKEKLAETQSSTPRTAPELSAKANEVSMQDETAALLSNTANPTSAERLKLGLFAYPILQAADILLYKTTHVPVGADQLVHIELARTAANTFNQFYGVGQGHQYILTPPAALTSKLPRVMSLTEPRKKMSKSAVKRESRVLVTDSAEDILKKFRVALTDSEDGITYDAEARPGVANLLEIIAAIEGGGQAVTPDEVAKDFANLEVKGSLKKFLKERAADVVYEALRPVREKFEQLTQSSDGDRLLEEVAEKGRVTATKEAETTMQRVRHAVGIS